MRFAPLALAALLALAGPAAAQDRVGVSPTEAAAWIGGLGGQVAAATTNGPWTVLPVTDGDMRWTLAFTGCQADLCDDAQYTATFQGAKATAQMAEAWNRDTRFLKATWYPAEDGGEPAITLRYDVLLGVGGLAQLHEPTALWVAQLDAFARLMAAD